MLKHYLIDANAASYMQLLQGNRLKMVQLKCFGVTGMHRPTLYAMYMYIRSALDNSWICFGKNNCLAAVPVANSN